MGRLPAALEHYDSALRIEPGMVMAWNNRGLVLRRLGQVPQAAASFDESIKRSRDFAPAYYNKADCLMALNRRDEAIADYDRAIALKPDFAEAHCNRANALLELERHSDALSGYDRAIALRPQFFQAHLSRGIALTALGRQSEALESFKMAAAMKPDYADAHYNLGKLLKELGRFEEALISYDEAIRLRPNHAETHSNRGNVLKELKLFDEALRGYDRAISLRPDLPEAHTNRGNVLIRLLRLEEGLASHDVAVRLNPDSADAHNNRGNALKELNRLDEALASFDRAIELKPDYAEAFSNRGNALRELGRLEDATESFNTALALAPAEPGILYNKAIVSLQRQDFAEGFEFYLARWNSEEFEERRPATEIPAWDGSDIEGEVLLWAEQGLGDEVFYASMLSLLEPGRTRIALSSDKRLHPIYARSFPGIRLIDRAATNRAITGPFAAQAPIGNLGHLLRADAGRIAQRRYPYLAASAERARQIAEVNPITGQGRICGISWRSGNKRMGASRSIRLAELAPVLTLPGLTFVNLQYGEVDDEIREAKDLLGVEVHRLQDVDVFNDIDGLLSAIDLCDMVLTIDNVTAHLAGALGKDSAVLVPKGKARYWYWGGERQSLWYPSLRLVYQESVGDWEPAIAAAARHLTELP
jgi:tetratricopeptide (TPR) repeat protein